MPTIPFTNRKVRDFAYLEKITRKGMTQKDWKSAAGSALGSFDEPEYIFRERNVAKSALSISDVGVYRVRPAAVTRLANEHQARIIYVFDLAKEAFGDQGLATKFMKAKHPLLHATPLQKLDTEWGGREVERILNSMIYGLPA